MKFQSQMDLDYRKPFKGIRNAPNEEIVVGIELAPNFPFLIYCCFLTIFLYLWKKLICAREPDFVNLPVFALLKNCQFFKNVNLRPQNGRERQAPIKGALFYIGQMVQKHFYRRFYMHPLPLAVVWNWPRTWDEMEEVYNKMYSVLDVD